MIRAYVNPFFDASFFTEKETANKNSDKKLPMYGINN
jgi:hypothetical protein